MNQNNRKMGGYYEKEAAAYLQKKGYKIIEQNFRCRIGEIDLIAKDGEELVFCEVKYRVSLSKGHPLEAVEARKQAKIVKTAYYYLMEHCSEIPPCRFDVIGYMNSEVIHIENAFECTDSYF